MKVILALNFNQFHICTFMVNLIYLVHMYIQNQFKLSVVGRRGFRTYYWFKTKGVLAAGNAIVFD